MKKMNLIALLLASLVLFSVKILVAQNTTFKLSDYKNPDYFYQTLDLNFRLNSTSGIDKNDNTSQFYNYKTYSLGSNAMATYSIYENSTKSQSELNTNINGSIQNNGENDTRELANYKNKKNNFSNNESLSIRGLKRFYNEKNSYFEANGSILVGNYGTSVHEKSYINDTISISNESHNKNFNSSLNISLLLGKGRIQQVQDARMALYLIEDLHQLNRNKRLVSDEDVIELAKLITSLKYKRFFDNRLRKIAEITAIDAFMQQKGIAGTADATYFTSLNDSWIYSNNPVRYSGWRIFTGIQGNFVSLKEKYTYETIFQISSKTEDLSNRQVMNGFILAGLDYEKPISLKWQNSASLKARLGTQSDQWDRKWTNSPDNNQYSGETPTFDLSANYGYGYYPNSRTWLTANWAISSSYSKEFTGTSKNDKENTTNSFYFYTGPSVQAYYYLSEKLRLSFYFNSFLQIDNKNYIANIPEGSDNNQTRTSWNNELSASLTYSLF